MKHKVRGKKNKYTERETWIRKKYGRKGNEKCENKGNAIIGRTYSVFPSLV